MNDEEIIETLKTIANDGTIKYYYNDKTIENINNAINLIFKQQKEIKARLKEIDSLYKMMSVKDDEIEELKEDNNALEMMIDIANAREYRKKYIEERRKEQPNLYCPDFDEIYERYYKQKAEIEQMKEDYQILKDDIEGHRIVYVDTPEFEENYISKDKIRELKEKVEKEMISNPYDFSYMINKLLGE